MSRARRSTGEDGAAQEKGAGERTRARLRVAVLMGGASSEREVSLASGCAVARALRSLGHHVTAVDSLAGALTLASERAILEAGIGGSSDKPGSAWAQGQARESGDRHVAGARVIAEEPGLRGADVVFVALHGGAGEDGAVQTLLDAHGLAYTGSGPLGCALAMDKDLSKRLIDQAGMRTPSWRIGPAVGERVADALGLPAVVKPVSGGSSVGLTLARSATEIDRATQRIEAEGDRVLYEAYIQGREFTVGVLDGAALPVVGIEPKSEFFDFACKYEEGMAVERAPADIPGSLARALADTAQSVHAILRLEHYSRVDFLVDDSGRIWCLEANALPGLTVNSLLPKAARAAGIELSRLCERICRLGMEAGARRGGSEG